MFLNVLVAGSGFPKLRSSVTLLRSDHRNILVDTGLYEDAKLLIRRLGALRLSPDDIDTVVSTHLHYDHCGNHLLFSKARYIVSVKDYQDTAAFVLAFHRDGSVEKKDTAELLRSKHQAIKEFYVRSIVRELTRNLCFYNRLLSQDPCFLQVDAPHWLTDQIEIIPTPGHTPGHISVVAHRTTHDIDRGPETILIAGDALFTRKTVLGNSEPEDIHLAVNAALYKETRTQLLAQYRYMVPGHDTLVEAHAQLRPQLEFR